MGRGIEWAAAILAFAATTTLAIYAGAAFLLWDFTPFSLAVARGLFLAALVSGIAAAGHAECQRPEQQEGKR